jgi:predicted AAA+ superfamily ATPase
MVDNPSFPRLLRAPKQSFFLFGPRGTGKSHWVRTQMPKAARFDLLDTALYQSWLTEPARIANELRVLPRGSVVCIDEVQRLPVVLNEVHRFIEEYGLRFVLCGSSARKLKEQGTNLLAGRAARRDLHPFVPAELGAAFDLAEALRHGTLPVIWTAPLRREALRAYVQVYLREEIQAEALVRNLAAFARFLAVAGLFHGQVLNVSSLARDAGTSRTTVNGYVEILEDTLLAFRLPAHAPRLRVRERKHPKLYWVDAGVARAARGDLGAPSSEEVGALFEGWVANLLRIHREHGELFEEWSYWAPAESERLEVDFLLRRDKEWLAIEAKSGTRLGADTLRGLHAVADLKGLVRRILVHRGSAEQRTEDGIEAWPIEKFHAAVAEGSLWP